MSDVEFVAIFTPKEDTVSGVSAWPKAHAMQRQHVQFVSSCESLLRVIPSFCPVVSSLPLLSNRGKKGQNIKKETKKNLKKKLIQFIRIFKNLKTGFLLQKHLTAHIQSVNM